jgi:hypothetical protein
VILFSQSKLVLCHFLTSSLLHFVLLPSFLRERNYCDTVTARVEIKAN